MTRPCFRSCLLAVLAALAAPAATARTATKAPEAAPAPTSPLVQAAQVLPGQVTFTAFLEGSDATAPLRAFLHNLGGARSGETQGQGDELARAVAVDLLSPQAQVAAGLSTAGLRVLLEDEESVALVAPVADAQKARARLAAWLDQLGPTRTLEVRKHKLLVVGGGKQLRAGLVADLGQGLRLHTASGKSAATLLGALVLLASGKDKASLAAQPLVSEVLGALHGPVSVWVRGRDGLVGAGLDIDLQESGLTARGRLLMRDLRPLLAGGSPSPEACAGTPLLCIRAAPGPLLRVLAALGLRQLLTQAVPAARRDELDALLQGTLSVAQGGALFRVEAIDWKAALAPEPSLAAAPFVLATRAPGAPLPPTPVAVDTLCVRAFGEVVVAGSPCPETAPAGLSPEGPTELVARIEPSVFLPKKAFSPFDALRSSAGPILLGMQALAGPLFARTGTVTVTLQPLDAKSDSRVLSLELRWPLVAAPKP